MATDRPLKTVTILEVRTPWDFLAVESPDSEDASPAAYRFSQMMENMNTTMNNLLEQGTVWQRPNEGDMCAALARDDNKWHRVRLESWLEKSKGHNASCYLIDKGHTIKVPVQRLLKLPSKYADLPSQVLHCSLWGVQPLSLTVEECFTGLKVEHRPCRKWDASASQYMSKKFDTCRKYHMQVIEKDSYKFYVRLFLNTKNGTVCFNDILVEENYAIKEQQNGVAHTQINSKSFSGTQFASQAVCNQRTSSEYDEYDMQSLVSETPTAGPYIGKENGVGIVNADIESEVYQDADEENCPPLVSETDLEVLKDTHQKALSLESPSCGNLPAYEESCPPLVSETDLEVLKDTHQKTLSLESPNCSNFPAYEESCPPLVSESDLELLQGARREAFCPESQNCNSCPAEEENCPPLVSESDHELLQATRKKTSTVESQDCDSYPAVLSDLEPSVADFFKQYMSSPEKSPPTKPLIEKAISPSQHFSKNQPTEGIYQSSCQSVESSLFEGQFESRLSAISHFKTPKPLLKSEKALSISLSSLQPSTHSVSNNLPGQPTLQVPYTFSKFFQGRGRALLSSGERNPGYLTQQPELFASATLPKHNSLKSPASGSTPMLDQTNFSLSVQDTGDGIFSKKIKASSLSSDEKTPAAMNETVISHNPPVQNPQVQKRSLPSALSFHHVDYVMGQSKDVPESGGVVQSAHLNKSTPSSVDERTCSGAEAKNNSLQEFETNLPLPESELSTTAPVASGTRARFRKSGDSLMSKSCNLSKDKPVPTKIVTLLKASAPDLRDNAVRQARGQAQGRQFLQYLKQSSGQVDAYPTTTRPGQPMSQPMFGILVHGKSLPVPTFHVDDAPFDGKVKNILERKFKIDTARSIQAHVWPASLSCRHVIGLTPPKLGKTMAYVPSIVSLFTDKGITYIDLPRGKGPLGLIVVPTWRKARDVFEMIQLFTADDSMKMSHIRPLVLYAGGTEEQESMETALITGCDILISTPTSVLRMLEQELTSFRRLCHVILDDADILARRFEDEIDDIMQQFRLVQRGRIGQQVAPFQVMMFASRWTDGLDQFRLKYTREPIIVISSRVEASVYGGIKQVVSMSKWEQRLSTFCALLDTLVYTDKRVVAFTSDADEAVEMWKAAKSRGAYCLLIHQNLPVEAATEAREQWLHSSYTKQLIVMVCTDQCYQDLAITNATDIIHYGLPDSKTKFGNRMACMFDYFRDRTTNEELETEAISHVILTDRCGKHAEQLNEILQRSPYEQSPQLEEFLRGYRKAVEEDERKVLCPGLKAFGTCMDRKNQEHCKYRHIVIPHCDLKTGEFDENSLPASGQVTVDVVRVETAGRYYCHLVNHRRPSDSAPHDLRLTYVKLAMELTAFCSKTSNQVPYLPSDDPFHDGLCVYKDKDGTVSRAKVVDVREGTRSAPMKQIRVWLVDDGCFKEGTVDQLLKMPKRLAEVPYQAVEVYLCCVKPVDEDTEWTDKVNIHMHDLVEGKQLVGRIMLRAGMTLWLMPLVHQVTFKEVGTTSDLSLRQELLQKKFAVRNPDHMKMLYELFRGKTDIPEALMRQHFEFCLEIELTQETLPTESQDEFVKVYIAAVISPGLFYLHREGASERLDELEKNIESAVKEMDEAAEQGAKVDSGMTLEQGSVCLALSSDSKWYRAKLVSDCVDGQWEVYFLDYGDREWIPQSSLRGLPRSLGELPCQAMECELAYISPIGADWSQDTVDSLCDLSYFANQEKKLLFAKVITTKDCSYAIGMKLVVDLYETLRENVRFSHELVKRHQAVANQMEHEGPNFLQPILGKPALKNQKFFNPLDKVKFLAANLYWMEDPADALQQAQELKTFLSFRMKGWDSALDQRQVLPSVVSVIGYIPDVTAHGVMLQTLTQCCVDSPRLCDAALEQGLLERLSSCIEQKTENEVQTQAAEAIARLLSCDSFKEECLETSILTLTLEQLLSSHSPESPIIHEALVNLCEAASLLVHAAHESLPNVCSMDTILKALREATQDRNREPWLRLLSAMSSKDCTHSYLMRQTNIADILSLLSTCSCPKCLYYCLSICVSLAEASRKHRKVLLENKLLITLNSLLESGLTSPALDICEQLRSVMTLKLPAPEVLSGIPAENNNTVDKVRCPEVLWFQNCFRVVLKVKVRNAQPDNFCLTSDRIACRVQSEKTLYEFDWELYDAILPEGSKIHVQPTKTIISLKKVTKGQWKRLCKQKVLS
ncbi:ATP-dependent RNA helicase dbp2 [Plakobranchus ocellatus]|uniref:RNA helicase n=1 Tax=Plakobranchus ocellatus TaxID=259542 RepID=A0AAV4BLT2_9GAST|nr:ATP-dependent RNA helicase dbp2 [Plakobranchus ocellatus]